MTLEKWCSEHDEKIYVIGQDPDLHKFCASSGKLIALGRPSEFIDKVLTQDAAIEAIERSVAENSESVSDVIGKEFSGLGFYLDDEEGEVNDVTLERVTVGDMSVLDVTGNTVKLEVDVKIDFVVNVAYDDMDTAVWDSEDKDSIPFHTIRTQLERSHETAIILTA